LDVILLVIFVVIAALTPVAVFEISAGNYHQARSNFTGPFIPKEALIFLPALLGLLLMMLGLMLTAVIRLLVTWRRCSPRTRILRGVMLLAMAGVLLATYWFWSVGDRNDPMGHGFRDWCQENADVPAIRTWATTLSNVPDDNEVPREKWPPAVTKAEPFRVTKECEGKVRLEWGSEFPTPYRGLVVGPQDMEMPKVDPVLRITNYETTRPLLPLAPGAYVYVEHEGAAR
jgi:hypothetical protein